MSDSAIHLGIDIGSVSVKAVSMSPDGAVMKRQYSRHFGNPLPALHKILESFGDADTVSATGSGARVLSPVFGLAPVNEVAAHAAAAARFHPGAKSIIEMGGEDSKLIVLADGRIRDFSMNAICAAGTGSFLDQQAERLCMSIEEFSQAALLSENPPRIAGRCSVFAKSDMIHLQQIATPVEDIVAGLCFAVARNFRSSICKGREIAAPVLFQGGVAANSGMLRAFREIFGLGEIIRPDDYMLMGAIGAVIADLAGANKQLAAYDRARLSRLLDAGSYDNTDSLTALVQDRACFQARHHGSMPMAETAGVARIKAYLGIDIGSISTNLAVTDAEGKLLAKRYLRTSGRPIEAVMTGLREVEEEIGGAIEITGVGTTGSGRYMIADYVGADIVKNEITAQATAAAFINPNVDTIFEIGGQDSKYIGLRNGVVVDFEMNKACAAGTGSFLEEQAEKLSISVKDEFSEMALSAEAPCPLGERCTVFMENSLMSRLQKGAGKSDLLAGLSYSIVKNYLNRVVGDRRIGENIFFQGGTAFNKSVVAAFEQVVGRQITVPPHHDVTGAIGMALIAQRHMKAKGDPASGFRGFDIWKRGYDIKSFECRSCDNLCEINTVTLEGETRKLVYGGRCEKYDVKRKAASNIPNLFDERAAWLAETHERKASDLKASGRKPRARLGLPRIFFFNDNLPFWSSLLHDIGFEVALSPRTNTKVIHGGLEAVQAEACYPVKVAHGHVKHLLDEGVDAVFIPSMIGLNSADERFKRGVACPYAQTIPYLTSVALGRYPAVTPIIDLGRGPDNLAEELFRTLKKFGVKKRSIRPAIDAAWQAQHEFQNRARKRGLEVLEKLAGRAVVVVGRSYNAFDPAMNLNIPRKLIDLDVTPIPMDFLPLHIADIHDEWSGMYWRSGQRLLQAARIIREDPRLFPLFITNFSCGPDSFILRFFKEKLAGKPFLQLEIDEHSADAGAVTRCEAFLDSLENLETTKFSRARRLPAAPNGASVRGRKIFVPRMCDHSVALAAAFEACGMEAEALPLPDKTSTEIGRKYVSGKECYPCAVTTGDMVKKAMSPGFDPARSAFLMPSGTGPCRFGQYNTYHRLILNELGMEEVPIFAPVQEAGFYRELGFVGNDFVKLAITGIIATDFLTKCLHETRPYERIRGESDALYKICLDRIADSVKSGKSVQPDLMKRIANSFADISCDGRGERPLIGMVGEIYVRSNTYTNEDLVRRIEELGGEVWLSPISEWFFYLNHRGMKKSLQNRRWKTAMSEFMSAWFQHGVEERFIKACNGTFRTLHEKPMADLLKKAAPYLHESFEGEAILSISKAVDLVEHGARGIINAMPFGCMPGTISGALLKAVKDDHGIPYLNAAYDGSESSTMMLQLEAFMHQVKEGV